MPNLIKIRSEAREFFHADGRTDGHDEAHCIFSQILRKHLTMQG